NQVCFYLFKAFLLPWILQTLASDSAMDTCRRKDRFYCKFSRECIVKYFVCDGNEDCRTGEDEMSPACTMEECRQKKLFFCDDSQTCIRKDFVCDGINNCHYGEDEAPSSCTIDVCHKKQRFFCNNSMECIDQYFVCDGYKDCRAGEDEVPPACNIDRCSQKHLVYCNVSRMCIHGNFVCDGINHCHAGEDEAPPFCNMDDCRKKDLFFCNVSRMCIRKDLVCNGINNCQAGEDEAPPACTTDLCRQNDVMFCNVSRKCIHKSFVCNGYDNCPYGEDEAPPACTLKQQCESNRSLSEGCLGQCQPGYFGKYCEETCLKECLNGVCNRVSGICNDCTRTYLENCSLECGQGCRERDGFPQCDRKSGKCLNGCNLYHYGHYCNETCRHCKMNSSNVLCDINGVCQFGCENDFWGKKCNTKCSVNCQGDEHGNRCNSSIGECVNGCIRGWSGGFCADESSLQTTTTESTDKEHVTTLKTALIIISAIFTGVVIVILIRCFLGARKRINRQQNELIEPRRAPEQLPSSSWRRQSYSPVHAAINEESMEHIHYTREQNSSDQYDEIDVLRCVPNTGIIHSKEFPNDSSSLRSVETSEGKTDLDSSDETKSSRLVTQSNDALYHVGKTDNATGVYHRNSIVKSDKSIELLCTKDYLDRETLCQTTKGENSGILAAKCCEAGEDIFGDVGQFRVNYIHAIAREECELLDNELEHKTIESSLLTRQEEEVGENSNITKRPAQSQHEANTDNHAHTKRQEQTTK
ncbi:VLDLR-like protein, partial [Mya arenaria]